MRKFNELKIETLGFLKQQADGDLHSLSKDVAKALDITVENAQMILLRLRRQRLVQARKVIGSKDRRGRVKRAWAYQINERGLTRLIYLKGLG